jgi:hypothetical protein
MKESELRQLIREQIILREIEEGFGDQVGAAASGIGKGISSVLSTVMGAVIIAGVLILKGAAALATGALAVAGFGAYGIMKALDQFVLVPKVNATLERLSQDPEVMAIAKKPTASGLRKVAAEKLTASERIMVGNFIKSNITRRQLGVGAGGRKLKSGPGLKGLDQTPLGDFI